MDSKQKEKNREFSKRWREKQAFRGDFIDKLYSKVGVTKPPVMYKPDKNTDDASLNNYDRRLDNLVETYLDRYYKMRVGKDNVSHYTLKSIRCFTGSKR
jgi:hypothetical protein